MINRRKIIRDNYGKEKNPKELITSFLGRNEKMTFGEIKKELKNMDISYADNKGLDLVLKALIEDHVIKKRPAKPYPLYYLTNKAITNIDWIADEFKREIAGRILNHPHQPMLITETEESHKIRDLILIYGVYMMYVQIQSWNIVNPKKSSKYNHDARRSWFIHTILHNNESLLFEKMITRLCNWGLDLSDEEYDEKRAMIYESKKKLKKFKEIEKTFKLQYKPYYDFFDKVYQKAPKGARGARDWIKEMQRKERTKKRREGKRK